MLSPADVFLPSVYAPLSEAQAAGVAALPAAGVDPATVAEATPSSPESITEAWHALPMVSVFETPKAPPVRSSTEPVVGSVQSEKKGFELEDWLPHEERRIKTPMRANVRMAGSVRGNCVSNLRARDYCGTGYSSRAGVFFAQCSRVFLKSSGGRHR